MISEKLVAWYSQNKRQLPWREEKNPYYTWVSEIMLQQTQVNTVIPYFLNFIHQFPTVAALAKADEKDLVSAWEGLGYYSRVRNMQVAAQTIMTDFNGVFPHQLADIRSLKGIGPYTAGAIASIAFDEATPAVDGNALRVYTRLFAIPDDISKPATVRKVTDLIQETMSVEHPGDFNQALMDLGSSHCSPKNYSCADCPLNEECQSYQQGTVDQYPYKKPKAKPVDVYYVALAIQSANDRRFYLQQRPDTGLLAKFKTFPLIEVSKEDYQLMKEESLDKDSLFAEVAEEDSHLLKYLPQEENLVWQTAAVDEVTHVFSHRKWHVLVAYGYLLTGTTDENWLGINEIDQVAFPKIQHKLWQAIQKKDK